MEFLCSPSRDGGPLHLSPTHPHHIDGSSAIRKLRRSMSRSPSKRNFPVPRSLSSSPVGPLSPTNSKSPLNEVANMSNLDDSSTPISTTRQLRPALKRSSVLQRTKPITRSPMRRALSDGSDKANGSVSSSQSYGDGQENQLSELMTPRESFLADAGYATPMLKPEDKISAPVTLPVRSDKDSFSVQDWMPAKSSPLKRSDGFMNYDRGSLESPSAKRRSVYGAAAKSSFDIPRDHTATSASATDDEHEEENDDDGSNSDPPVFRSPLAPRTSLHSKSHLHQRMSDRSPTSRVRRSVDFAVNSPNQTHKSRPRSSLDSAHARVTHESAQTSETDTDLFRNHQLRNNRQQPHPLSRALIPTSPTPPSGSEEDPQQRPPLFESPAIPAINFARSLPIGAIRPQPQTSNVRSYGGNFLASDDTPFATPNLHNIARPDPAAFRSTGLISKRHRNPDELPPPPAGGVGMPDTPCKKVPSGFSYSPSPRPSASIAQTRFAQPEFGTPSRPFNPNSSKPTPSSLGRSANIFGSSYYGHQRRRTSFASIEGEEVALGNVESQSSNDELPPTPTKHMDIQPNLKQSSLRSSIFGRRPSMGPSTFVPPNISEQQMLDLNTSGKSISSSETSTRAGFQARVMGDVASPFNLSAIYRTRPVPSFARSRLQRQSQTKCSPSPLLSKSLKVSIYPSEDEHHTKSNIPTIVFKSSNPGSAGASLPQTPADVFPDPSGLSISPRSPQSPIFHQSVWARPPETPTPHRDAGFTFAANHPSMTPGNHGTQAHDVDPILISRFKKVEWYGQGTFSEVYRVYQQSTSVVAQSYFSPSVISTSPQTQTPRPDKVFIVKKSRTPYHSHKIRQRKMQEVSIMASLGRNDHIVRLVDSWEAHHHLYIQTEYCEEGSLHDFLAKTGHKGRLDDFRIWKILIEMCLGVKHIHDSGFIHLDLKPANVFIDFSGVLKIGDFGHATQWPAPDNADGEGDRRYMGPDLLQGSMDKPADVFALGMMMFEIAGNCIPPDNGVSWHKLRSGDWSGLPSLTSGSSSSIEKQDDSQDDLITSHRSVEQGGLNLSSIDEITSFTHTPSVTSSYVIKRDQADHTPTQSHDLLSHPPRFMLDPEDPEALDVVVHWMMAPRKEQRPMIDEILETGGVRWVNARRRAGAVVFEGTWGPEGHVLKDLIEDDKVREDAEMLDV